MLGKLFLLFCFIYLCQCDPLAIPGSDFVGFGYDIRQESPKTALQFPILTWTYAKAKTYIYPADPSQKEWAVPDQLFVRTVAQTVAQSRLFTSIDEVQNSKALDIGIDFSQSLFTNSTNQTCVTRSKVDPDTGAANDTTDCQTTGVDVKTQAFSLGADFNYASSQLSTGNIVVTDNSEHTELFSLLLNKATLHSTFKNDMEELTKYPWPGDRFSIQKYFDFLEKYGTHYVIGSTMGGTITMESFTQISTDKTDNTIGVTATGTDSSNRNQILANSQSRFVTSVSGVIDVKTSKQVSESEFRSSTNFKLFGGDSNLVNLLDSSTSSEVFLTWKKTIVANPVPTRYRLKEISSLFDDDLRQNFKEATKLFIQADNPREIISITPPGLATNSSFY